MILIGIDDTDKPEGHGTGYLARQLCALIAASGIARVDEITRHQLLFDRRIPYTSHNSALCMRVEVQSGGLSALAAMCRSYLLKHSAVGSDAGLCIATSSDVSPVVEDFGFKAKKEILTQDRARELARCEGLSLEGLTGDHGERSRRAYWLATGSARDSRHCHGRSSSDALWNRCHSPGP
ncbi:MAG: hypothetical protein K5821_03650 [Nitrobacter sp.]|uniref:hypothetical protein n=1 Tax=Nitrobacter sp. TaxID=29420 RepID=UPI002608F64E|nr:hypothetical protein [Nitrobacter sp.]MCV0385513.1 hypothetical protein [Nitrobacter sp.]